MILNALVEKLKHRSKDNSKGHCHNQVYPAVTATGRPSGGFFLLRRFPYAS